MKIIFSITSLHLGGAERAVTKLANYWSSKGHEIHIITMAEKGADFYFLDPGVNRVALNLMPKNQAAIFSKILLQFRRIWGYSRSIKSIRPDILMAFSTDSNLLALQSYILHRTPFIISERTNPYRQTIKKLPALLRRVLYPFARKIVFVSEGVARCYSWISKDRKTVILNALEKRGITHVERNKEIVALGRLMPVKGFDLLVKAFASIAENHPDWSLSIYGDGPLKAELGKLILDTGLSGRVVLKGHTKDPYPILSEAGIFVLSSRYEGFPNSLMEAMSVGAPCVSFDCDAGPNEIISHRQDGLLVEPENIGKLAEAISYMIENPSERARMGNNALAINDRLAIEKISAQWGRVIEEVTGKSFL